MDFKQALAALKKLGADDVTDIDKIVEAIEGEAERLNSKNYELIGESRKATQKARTLQESIDAILETVGGEGDDPEAKLKDATNKVKTLSSELTQARQKTQELETKATTAEQKAAALERSQLWTRAAAKSGAVAEVLGKLLKDVPTEKIEIGDDVKVDGKPLREYLESSEDLKVFIPAAFPGKTPPPPPRLPNGGPTPPPQGSVYEKAIGRKPDQDLSWIGKKAT